MPMKLHSRGATQPAGLAASQAWFGTCRHAGPSRACSGMQQSSGDQAHRISALL